MIRVLLKNGRKEKEYSGYTLEYSYSIMVKSTSGEWEENEQIISGRLFPQSRGGIVPWGREGGGIY